MRLNMNMRLFAIRGAVCADNTPESITEATDDMCRRIFTSNNIQPADIVSIQFSITPDLDALNPAAALRHSSCASIVSSCALFCAAEPVVKNMLPRVIRVMVNAYMDENASVRHVYIRGAEVLRPDFSGAR
jgi:chorismate mutase